MKRRPETHLNVTLTRRRPVLISLVIIAVSALVEAGAQTATSPTKAAVKTQPPPMVLTAQQDHQKMMDVLGIASIRQGRGGRDPQSPNYANYDESKANPFPKLPDPLVLKNGQKVSTPDRCIGCWERKTWARANSRPSKRG